MKSSTLRILKTSGSATLLDLLTVRPRKLASLLVDLLC
jgi:hypothetical protein